MLYGAGVYAGVVEEYLMQHGMEVAGKFVDDQSIRKDDVATFQELSKRFANFNIVIAIADHRRARRTIMEKLDCNNVHGIFHFVLSPHYHDTIDLTFVHKHQERIQTVHTYLGDEFSKKTLVKTNVSGDDQYLFEVLDQNQYFPDVVTIDSSEIFVDGGAYTGDTLAEFMLRSKEKYCKYYALEPDTTNMQTLKTLVSNMGWKNVVAINKGLWSKEGEMSFFEDGNSTDSRLVVSGSRKVFLQTIDSACSDASFIKMDIEGSELEALKGARHTILKNQPKLAICVYHKPEDLWEIPYFVKSLVPEYKLYLRQHRTICTELVLYATV